MKANLKSFTKILFVQKFIIACSLLSLTAHWACGQTQEFPNDSWGVYSWTQFTDIDKVSAPLAKGGPIIMRWANVEPQNGIYAFDSEIGDKLRKAETNGFYVFLKIYLAGPAPSGFTPEWLYSSGVPKVTISGNSFPYYFDEDYKILLLTSYSKNW